MSPSSIKRLTRLVREFRSDTRGNIAIIFALVAIPLVALVGAAVDYTRAASARTALQSALDSAALMISKDAATLSDSATITARARQYVDSLYTATDTPIQSFTATYTPNSGSGATILLTAGGTMPTYFMRVMGSQFDTLPINASSTTNWGSNRLRVAMALDVTGSMADDGKMQAMQTAAKNLVDTLTSGAKSKDDVYISVVPFAQMVNVGASNRNADWIKWSGQSDTWDENNGSCSGGTSYKTKSACTSAYVCSSSKYTTQRKCEQNNKTWGKANYVWTPDDHNTWKGCVMDRDQPYDAQKDLPTSDEKRFPATQYEQSDRRGNQVNICPDQILPMTSVYSGGDTTIKNKIDDLEPNGGTNQAIGMAWAWLSLQQGDPLNTPAKDSNYTYTDAIILLSDGLNTIDRWYGNGSDPSPDVDARQTILCQNIKTVDPITKKKPLVFTIQVNTTGDPESAVLKACADSDSFFSTSNAQEITSAFNSIGATLMKLRISK